MIDMMILRAQNDLRCKIQEIISIYKTECVHKKFEILYEINLHVLSTICPVSDLGDKLMGICKKN